jgi:hypothetical protein
LNAAVLQVLPDDYRASRDNSLALSASESEPNANIHQTPRDFPEQKVFGMTGKIFRRNWYTFASGGVAI